MKIRKIALSVAVASTLIFSGCANNSNSLSTSTIGSTKEVKRFLNGEVIKTEKVLVDKSMNAILVGGGTGAVVGAVGGAVARGDVKGAVVGGAVGAVVGGVANMLLSDNEEVSFRTTILSSDNKKYTAYIQKQLRLNTQVEFVARDNGKVTNVSVSTDVNDDSLVDYIDKRFYKNGLWNYHLKKYDLVVTSKKKYYYLNDTVDVTFDNANRIKKIVKIR